MIVPGFLLMLACIGLAVDAVIENTSMVSATVADRALTDMSLGTVFVGGAVVGLIFALGMAMFVGGLGRSARKRRERKELLARDRDAYPADEVTPETTTAGQTTTSGRHRR